MGRRVAIVAAGTASAAAIFAVTAALAAYSSPRLEATQSGNRITLDLAQSAGDDATAITRIISPVGTGIAAARPAGAAVGSATAEFVATASGDQRISAQGALRVVDAPPADASGCSDGERVVGTWSLALAGDGLAFEAPVYLLVGGDLLLCIPHPSTVDRGGKLVSLQLTIDGPLDLTSTGTWISIWVPYGGLTADTTRIVASPAIVAGGSVTFTARAKGAGAVLVGFVRQGGAPRADARVRITGGPRASRQRVLGTASTNRQGQFTFRAKSGTFFRANAVVPRASPPGLCFVLEPLLRPIPCVNPTLNGFSVQSPAIRKR